PTPTVTPTGGGTPTPTATPTGGATTTPTATLPPVTPNAWNYLPALLGSRPTPVSTPVPTPVPTPAP
ncbi:MAG TPA: hypothetical protein PLC06_16320, partial [Promineifilum sp.]|nr:hypothetical protein [Promineifilum sp.]